MPSSFTSLTYHIIFSTKHRKPLLVDGIRAETYRYIGGIIHNKGGQLIEIGGIEDHIHILASCSPKVALADFIRDIKANASRWINEPPRGSGFAWQTGYGAFTVSVSQIEAVRRYIRNQAEHHRRMTFAEELQAVLQKHGIAFDEARLYVDEFHG